MSDPTVADIFLVYKYTDCGTQYINYDIKYFDYPIVSTTVLQYPRAV